MSKTERAAQRYKRKKVYKPPASERQEARQEIDEALEEWHDQENMQTYEKDTRKT